jgi:hypothetical protein
VGDRFYSTDNPTLPAGKQDHARATFVEGGHHKSAIWFLIKGNARSQTFDGIPSKATLTAFAVNSNQVGPQDRRWNFWVETMGSKPAPNPP